jgi:uncharacterized membrane protein YczE
MCWSIAQMVQVADLGINPWINLYYALSMKIGWMTGTWDVVLSLLTFFIMFLIVRLKYFGLHTLLTLVSGFLVNGFLISKLYVVPNSDWESWLLLVISAFGAGIGGGISNATNYGNSLRTGFVIMVSDLNRIPFVRAKLMIEMILIMISMLLLHFVAIGTLVIYLIDTFSMSWVMPRVQKWISKS